MLRWQFSYCFKKFFKRHSTNNFLALQCVRRKRVPNDVNDFTLVSLLLTLNILRTLFWEFMFHLHNLGSSCSGVCLKISENSQESTVAGQSGRPNAGNFI